jgi:hypothetical protein
MRKPALNREQIAKIAQGVPQTIAALEKVFGDVAGMPSTIEEANALAGLALSTAAQALAILAGLAAEVEQFAAAPAHADIPPNDDTAPAPPHMPVETDDTTPRVQLGTLSGQNHDQVDITGGTAGLNAGTASAPSLHFGGDSNTGLYYAGPGYLAITVAAARILEMSTGLMKAFGTLAATGQIVTEAPEGTPPFSVSSDTLVDTLYVARAAESDHAQNANTANYATDAGTAEQLADPSTFPTAATDLPTVIALANALRSAAITKGL